MLQVHLVNGQSSYLTYINLYMIGVYIQETKLTINGLSLHITTYRLTSFHMYVQRKQEWCIMNNSPMRIFTTLVYL